MKGIKLLLPVVSIIAALSHSSVTQAYTFRIDSFKIIKNGSLLFEDTFSDGSTPPSAPNLIGGNPISYSVAGTLGPETGGKLTFDTSGAIAVPPIVGVQGFLDQRAILLTNADPNNLLLGLKIDDTFSVTGVFDLVVPGPRRELYGIRLTDGGNDILELSVRRSAAGDLRIELRRLDVQLDSVTTIASLPLDPLHEQIALTLSRPTTANNNIVASFAYIDRGVTGPVTTLPSTAAIFRGENFTRAGFMARTPFFPGPLRATVGNQVVYLNWDPPPIPVDGYNIFVEQFDDNTNQFVQLGTVNPAGVLIQNTTFKVFGFANGQFVENGQLYRFTVQAVENGVQSGFSNRVLARPNEFAVGQIPRHPEHPILFLHGFGFPFFSVDASTWDDTKTYLREQLGWNFGCELVNVGQPILTNFESIVIEARNCEPAGFAGDFFTVTFGNDSANYADGRGILHQADEVGEFVSRLLTERSRQGLPFNTLSLVAHSMGGLAARSYLATIGDAATNLINDLTTYGTPHAGAPRASFGQIFSDGARDMEVDCISGVRVNSPFLLDLRGKRLPNIRYFGILGHIQNFVFYAVEHQTLSGCFSTHWDGVVTIDSADWSDVVVPRRPQLLTTTKGHVADQTSDFSAILCALNRNCFVVNVGSPVDVEVTGPDGNSIAADLAEIPGATYTELNDEIGHSSAFVVIPFPLPGEYMINVIPKDESSLTDTYTLQVTRNGTTTTLAQDQSIQNIPSQPFVVDVPFFVRIDIKPGDVPNSINRRSQGKIPVAILSTPNFDASAQVNRLSLTFGHSGDETSLDFCNTQPADVNGDGLPDLVCHFNTQLTGFQVDDTEGVLKGQTVDGLLLRGTDSVRIVR